MSPPSLFAGLRLLLVGPKQPPAGGMATQTEQLFRLLREGGADVEYLPTNLAHRPAFVARVPVLRAMVRLAQYLSVAWQACGRADVIHLMANSGWSWHLFAAPVILIGRLRGRRIVVNYRGGGAAAFLGRQSRWVRPVLERSDLLIVPSGFLESVFAAHGVAARVVPNVVDLDRFSPAPERDTAAPHLVVARHLEAIYDNATALRAFARVRNELPQARLTVAGIGPERVRLEQLATDLGVRDAVAFPGQLDRRAMAELYREADVVLNPSLTDNMPNSVLEAMASGVPVVSSRVGGVPWILRDGETGLLTAPGDAAAIADATLRLCSDRALRRRIADAALAEVRRYRWPEVAPLLAAAYRGSPHGTSRQEREGVLHA